MNTMPGQGQARASVYQTASGQGQYDLLVRMAELDIQASVMAAAAGMPVTLALAEGLILPPPTNLEMFSPTNPA